jgi:hypothetical protein
MPKPLSRCFLEIETGGLFRARDEFPQVGVAGHRGNDHVDVVRHVAVRINLKSVGGANAQNLLVNDGYRVRRYQEAIPFERAEGQEIRKRADIVKRREMMWIFGHDRRTGNRRAG